MKYEKELISNSKVFLNNKDFLKVVEYGASLIAKRPLSDRELRTKLIDKGYSVEITEQTVCKMKEMGFIDDKKFARDLSDELLSQKQSLSFIVNKLSQRFIDKEIIDEVIGELKEEYNPQKQILEIISKKFKSADSIDEKTKNKIAAYLERKGFEFDDIEKILNNLK